MPHIKGLLFKVAGVDEGGALVETDGVHLEAYTKVRQSEHREGSKK